MTPRADAAVAPQVPAAGNTAAAERAVAAPALAEPAAAERAVAAPALTEPATGERAVAAPQVERTAHPVAEPDPPPDLSATNTADPHVKHRFLITATVVLASTMQALDNTIANVALPHIQGSLSATQDQMTWVLTTYIIAAAVMTPLSGWLSGHIGRRRVFLFSLVGFTVASALCGLAQSLSQIVIARLLQGLCGAALVPLSQAILLDINPPHQHAKAMATWAMAVSGGPILGPAFGGWLTENYSWRWVFYINVPIGIISILGVMSFLFETPLRKSRFDFFGFTTLSLAIGTLQLLLDRGQLEDWFSSTQIWIFASVAVVSFYLFVVHIMTTSEAPFLRPAVFKDRNYTTGSMFIFIIGIVMFATLAQLPPLLQGLMNYPVMLTGWITAPRGLGSLASMYIVGRLMRVLDARAILAIGFAISAFSLAEMTNYYIQMDTWTLMWTGSLQGLGMGLIYVPLATLSFGTLAPAYRDEGTAMFSLIRNIGSSIGIAVATTLFTRNTQLMHSRLGENITPYLDPWHPAISGAAGMAAMNRTITSQAEMIAYNNNFKLMMILTLCAIPLIALLRKPKPHPQADPVVVE